jgi:predicted GNAT family acetyltransferase
MKEYISALKRFNPYFEGYNNNIPVIYSTLEGQYQGVIYCDDEEEIAILVTKFDFIFLGGDIDNKNAEDIINDIIFKELVQRQHKKEIIVFGQNEKWNSVLSKVFQVHHGVSDLRKCYKLDLDKFRNINCENKHDNVRVVVKNEHENGSTIEYPVSRVYFNNINVSICSAFMLARGFAEIDVATDEDFRQKGYAKIGAIALIKKLIHHGIEPNWCTWPYRFESQALALSLGFELDKEVPVYIWVEEFGF